MSMVEGKRNREASARGMSGRERMVERAIRPGDGRSFSKPAAPSRPPPPALSVGEDVVHGKWGEGVVLEIVGAGDEVEVVVRFPSVGEKRLLLAWAPLKKAAG
jgi:DNA helicase-2/ATP-dependent DNA helicase PcrA